METTEISITKQPIKTQIAIRILYWLIAPTIILTISLAWWKYPEHYSFFREFISQLGSNLSKSGFPNNISSLIMTVGFAFCGLITLIVAIIYFIKRNLRYNYWKGLLNLVLFIGAIGITIPNDHPTLSLFHDIGSGLFIFGFGLLNFISQLLGFSRKNRPKPSNKNFDFYLDSIMVVIVFLVLILFLLFYILGKATSNYSLGILAIAIQKIILIVDFIAIFFLDLDDI